MGYSFQLAARVLLYALSRQDSTYYSLCYTSRGALAGMRNRSMGPPWNTLTTELHLAPQYHRATSCSSTFTIPSSTHSLEHITYNTQSFTFNPQHSPLQSSTFTTNSSRNSQHPVSTHGPKHHKLTTFHPDCSAMCL